MNLNLDKYKKDLDDLIEMGYQLLAGLVSDGYPKEKKKYKNITPLNFKEHYEKWYSEAQEVIRLILPNRLNDFVELYKADKRKTLKHSFYTISDYLIGILDEYTYEIQINSESIVPNFKQQLVILQSAKKRFESSLFDIKQIVQAEIFDSETEAARELIKIGFLRPAGVIAGIILENHLSHVCNNHKIKIIKKSPVISDYNNLLKTSDIIDTPTWRKIQYLADLRNLCAHNKKRTPKKEEVSDLIDGVVKMTKTIF